MNCITGWAKRQRQGVYSFSFSISGWMDGGAWDEELVLLFGFKFGTQCFQNSRLLLVMLACMLF